METVEKSVRIHAPAKKIFDFVSDPSHLPAIWVNMTHIHDIQMLSQGRHRYHWRYKLCGVRFEGESECVEQNVPARLMEKWRGGLQGQVEWMMQPSNGDTQVTMRLEYVFPAPLTQKHTCEDVNAEHARDVETVLNNLKRVLEE
ncbi:MAG: SRPBCC family protein [Anaerolineae bacterium]|nr:SRPBCC family protein [Anaerolineae bacterium]